MKYPDVVLTPKAGNRYDSLLRYYWAACAPEVEGGDWFLLKAIMHTENSKLLPYARSHAGAIGLFQFMPATAEEVGISPIDPEQSAFGASVYFRSLWLMWRKEEGLERIKFACGSYNAGAGNILKAQHAAAAEGLPPDQWSSIASVLPKITGVHAKETIDYVSRIMVQWKHFKGDKAAWDTSISP